MRVATRTTCCSDYLSCVFKAARNTGSSAAAEALFFSALEELCTLLQVLHRRSPEVDLAQHGAFLHQILISYDRLLFLHRALKEQ
jgi:hypothetical protein